MKYGEKYEAVLIHKITKERYPVTLIYKRTEWGNYHTDNEGDGLWYGDKQIKGTCQFTVSGCKTEKSAKAKIRECVKDLTFYIRK